MAKRSVGKATSTVRLSYNSQPYMHCQMRLIQAAIRNCYIEIQLPGITSVSFGYTGPGS